MAGSSPCYYYEPNAITVAVTSKTEPEDTEHITWLFLPMVQEEIDRALLRGGITDPADVRLRLEDSQLPNEVDVLLDMEYETLSDLNELAEATDGCQKRIWKSWVPWSCWQSQSPRHRSKTLRKTLTSLTSPRRALSRRVRQVHDPAVRSFRL